MVQNQEGKGPEIYSGNVGNRDSTEASKEESNGAKNEPRRTGKLILILAYQKIKIFRCGSGFGF